MLKGTHATALAALLAMCAAIAGCSTAQHRKPVLSAVKGRVFAISVSGDLMPARMANVYLLRLDEIMSGKNDLGGKVRVLTSDCQTLERLRSIPSDFYVPPLGKSMRETRSAYRTHLSEFENAVRGMVASSKGFTAQADEDGWFSFDQIPPGSYVVTAFGQAGANLGVWSDEWVLKPGERAETKKLSTPEVSCLLVI